jgi:hypothetical protein
MDGTHKSRNIRLGEIVNDLNIGDSNSSWSVATVCVWGSEERLSTLIILTQPLYKYWFDIGAALNTCTKFFLERGRLENGV